jgi:alpha-tubulin suppressor-like RCC1 family protein
VIGGETSRRWPARQPGGSSARPRIARRAPALAPAAAASVTTALSAGYSHTCVIRGGKAWSWGDSTYGELGNGSTISSGVPVPVYTGGVLSGVILTQISSGQLVTCTENTIGAVYFGGGNGTVGQLGDNSETASDSDVAVQVVDLMPSAPTSVTAFPSGATATIYWVDPASFGTTTSAATCTITGPSYPSTGPP